MLFVVQQDEIKIMSRLIQNKESTTDNASWVTHTTAQWKNESIQTSNIDIDAVIGIRLRDDFTSDYLNKVGVSAMGFPWIISHLVPNYTSPRFWILVARTLAAPSIGLTTWSDPFV